MERWLSLTVTAAPAAASRATRPLYFISIPKKIVKQAVRRNRLKRVLREALKEQRLVADKKRLVFKVVRAPERAGLEMAKEAVQELLRNV